MSNEEIKSECETLYEVIKKSQDRIKELRILCKHTKVEPGYYSWRPGCIEPAEICCFCGEVTKILNDFSKPVEVFKTP